MQTARAGGAARRARSRPATKRYQLVGLVVVEVAEVVPCKGGALQVLCHGAVSIRRVATRVRNAGLCQRWRAACRASRGVRAARPGEGPETQGGGDTPFLPKGEEDRIAGPRHTSGPVIDAGAPAVLSWAHAQARRSGPRLHGHGARWAHDPPAGPARQEGAALVLPQGRHPRLNGRGKRIP